jgi:hypothetical protein
MIWRRRRSRSILSRRSKAASVGGLFHFEPARRREPAALLGLADSLQAPDRVLSLRASGQTRKRGAFFSRRSGS